MEVGGVDSVGGRARGSNVDFRSVVGRSESPRALLLLLLTTTREESRQNTRLRTANGATCRAWATVSVIFAGFVAELHLRITHLPGFNGSLPFYLETGYVTVNEKSGAELFYYFVESDRKPKDDPLILWLVGGPYCSGFIGFALDIGPLKFNVKAYDGTLPTLISNPYSWTKISSIIFLDWPVGTGFSFSRSMVDYHTDDVQSTMQIYKFLIKGYLVGNPVTGERIDISSRAPHAHGLGIISHELFKMLLLLFFNLCVFPYYCNTLHASRVTHLPGFNGSLPFYLETGYVTVNEKSGAELFYYFVESDRKPKDDPLILWLVGGPYCSGFIGFALDIGPLKFNVKAYDGTLPTLISNPYSWTKWLLAHPSFQSNPFYVGGDSYGGKMVPLLALEIVEGNEDFQQLFVNLKGYLVGNPVTSERIDISSRAPHAHGLGIISHELFKNDRILSYYWSNDNLTKEALHIKEGGSHTVPDNMPLQCFVMFQRSRRTLATFIKNFGSNREELRWWFRRTLVIVGKNSNDVQKELRQQSGRTMVVVEKNFDNDREELRRWSRRTPVVI
ncbi:Serine carboxypeptidase-like 6 [Dendrobium catenatum]|uniref:Serine carboxypeptidase-like 6 n=1 Tax=Dendrobium catenatum TaxID=906689 RepID=A0A2I0WYT9_9ASPA|nr:Serine carboxypeptidase-like 6 [Dendrobium catenatum]